MTRTEAEACVYKRIENEISKRKSMSRKEIHELFKIMPSCIILFQEQSGELWRCESSILFPGLIAPVEIYIFYDRENNVIPW